MNAINAIELKTQGILAIMAALEHEEEVAITEEGKPQFIVMGMEHYQKLREYELKIAILEAKADIAAGQYVIETADEHINRMIKEYRLQTENA
jgi:PHD/YefM family antitoxin component YafN of YafNO toxin-antitoxin module